MSASAVALQDPWRGTLQLGYTVAHGRTVLARRRHQGPLLVQRSFHPEGTVCHNYLVHPPGGLVGGDQLCLEVELDAEADVLLTTPAAGKCYRSAGATAEQLQQFQLAPGAALEWLPAETILHGGARTRLLNRFELQDQARLLAWDVLCLGRPGSGDHFSSGSCLQDLRLFRSGRPLLHERLQLVAGDPLLDAPWGLNGYTVIGMFIATPVQAALAETLQRALPDTPENRIGLTLLDDVLVCRCLGRGAESVRAVLEWIWRQVREPVLGRVPQPPRIWKT